MNRSERFSPARILLVIRRDLVLRYRTIGVVAGTVALALLVFSVGVRFGRDGGSFHLQMYRLFLFIGGAIISSLFWSDIHRKDRSADFFLLPASPEEKFAARFSELTILFIPATILGFTLFSLAAEGVNLLVWGSSRPLFLPFDAGVWRSAAHFLVFQSVFVAGGVFFRKHQAVKTVLVLAAASIAYGILLMLLFRIVFNDVFSGFAGGRWKPGFDAAIDHAMLAERAGSLSGVLVAVLRTGYWLLIAPFMWLFAWLRLRETEVGHEI